MTTDLKIVDNDKIVESDEEKAFFDSSSFMEQASGAQGEWSHEQAALADMSTIKGFYYQEDWVYIVLDTKCAALSASPLIVRKKMMQDGEEIIEDMPEHDLTKYFEQPNSYQDYSSWMYNICLEYDLMGNAIIWKPKLEKELIPLAADRIDLLFSSASHLAGYSVINTDTETTSLDRSIQKIASEEIIHIKRPNPNNLFWGMSAFLSNTKSIMFNRYSTDYLIDYFRKGANPSAVIKLDKSASPEAMIKVQRSFEQSYTGRRNQRRPIILPKGYELQEFSSKISDQNIEGISKMNLEKLLNILKVPKQALSMQESGSLGSDEFKSALRWFYQQAIIPTQKKIAGALTKAFKDQLADNEVIEFDNSDVEFLKQSEKETIEIIAGLKGILTPNEIRAKYLNTEAHPDGDSLKESSFSQPMFEEEEPEPVIEEPKPQEPEESEEDKQLKQYEDGCRFVDAVQEKFSEWVKKQDMTEQESKGQLQLLAYTQSLFLNFLNETIEILKENFVEKAAETDINELELKQLLKKAFDQYEKEFVENYRQILAPNIEIGYDTQLSAILNGNVRQAVQVLRQTTTDGKIATLQTFGAETFDSISKTQTKRIIKTIADGVGRNQSIQDIVKDLLDNYKTIGTRQAETIARTETLSALSLGKAAMMEDVTQVTADTDIEMVKVWMNGNDERVRGNPSGLYPNSKADHWTIQGQVVAVDKDFKNGLRYPRDRKQGDAGETINCRCNWLVTAKEDLESLNVPGLHK